ncbi:hypothetical protein HMPREF2625_01330 [Rothia sp. HMSC064D08]|nr:hypothetical protein HMPREF2625_01330 [Rothia sp. HMSC064D08]
MGRRLYLDSIFVLFLLRTYIRQVEQSFGEQALLKELQGSPLIVHPFGSKNLYSGSFLIFQRKIKKVLSTGS